MNALNAIFKRELRSYFITPLAYVFLAVFTLSSMAFTFYIGGFYERGIADLSSFFEFHPWLYLFLIPAISMRLWAEEKSHGTIELLFTLPIKISDIIIGKFLAAWCFVFLALLTTFPIWVSVAYLGNPDHGLIISGYWGSFIMAGAYLSIGSFISALTKSQIIAFVLSAVVCFIFTISGTPMVLAIFENWLPQNLIELLSSFSFINHFTDMQRGLFQLNSLIFYGSFMCLFLCLTYLVLNKDRR